MGKLYMIALLCLVSIVCNAQLLDEPERKSQVVIVVLTRATLDDAYRATAHALQDQGWSIEQADPVLYTLRTDWKELGGFWQRELQSSVNLRQGEGGAVHAYLTCKVRQSGTTDTAAMGMNDEDGFYSYTIQRRTNMGKDWKLIMEVAESLGSEFLYK